MQILRTFFDHDAPEDIEIKLATIEFALNYRVHASTGMSPFELEKGYLPRAPADLILNNVQNFIDPQLDDFLIKVSANLRVAQDAIAAVNENFILNDNRREIDFAINDYVWLSTKNLHIPSFEFIPAKLRPKFVGPFKILQKVNPNAFKLDFPDTIKIHPVINVEFLKKFHGDSATLNDRPPPIIVNGTEEYVVEKILGEKIVRGKRLFVVKWLGYPITETSEEPLEHIENTDAYQEYIATRQLQAGRRGRRKS